MPSAVALVPARAGSQRVPGKNLHVLRGHPLIAYAIAAARDSGVFQAVVVSTDSEEIADAARRYGAEVPELRPADLATTVSPDFEWIEHMRSVLAGEGRSFDLFSIVRPTSPFRGADTIRRAWDALLGFGDAADSIRAVELVRQHPGKMWVMDGGLMRPLLPQPGAGQPYHSRQYQALPEVWVQNSSLEIAWTRVLDDHGDISGRNVVPLRTEGAEGFSIDYPADIEAAERLVDTGRAVLPSVAG